MKVHFSPFYEQDAPSDWLWNVNGFDIVRCARSGLVYLANPPSDSELEQFYSVEYFEGEQSRQGYASYEADENTLRRNARSMLDHVLDHSPARDSLVDYGGAYGYFLDEAMPHFASATGIELNEQVADVGRNRFNLAISTDASAVLQPGSVDVITMWDVIEHLKHPRTALAECGWALRPDGRLFLTTGDIGSPLARAMGRRWRLINPPQHITYFSKQTISELLEAVGFEVIEITRRCGKHVSLGFAAFIVGYLLGRKTPSTPPQWLARRSLYVNLFDTMLVTARKG